MGNAESSQDHGRQVHDELKLGWCNESRDHKRDLRTVSAVPVVQTAENTTRPIDRDREEAMERVRRQGERNTSFASGQSQILGKHSYYPDTISAPGITRIAQYNSRQFLRTCSCSMLSWSYVTHIRMCMNSYPYSSPASLRPLSELCSLWGWAAANAVSETSAAAAAARFKDNTFGKKKFKILLWKQTRHHKQQNDMCEFMCVFGCVQIWM